MNRSTTRFITRMKLRELRRQRAKLREAYEELLRSVGGARDHVGRLRLLYEGLKGLTFAGRPLHPDVGNLEILFHEADAGAASPEVVALWAARLEEEVAAGRSRSAIVALFGALLEEWARGESVEGPLAAEARAARDRLLGEALIDPGPTEHRAILDPLFEGLGPALDELAERVREACRERLCEPVTGGEMEGILERLGANIYRPGRLRREAKRFARDKELRKELADALTILLAELPTWDWPAEGLATRALWTRNKWRLYLDEDLPVACLMELLGERWIGELNKLVGDREVQLTQRRGRLAKLLDLGAPEVILTNERRMLRVAEQMIGLGSADGGEGTLVDAPAPESGSVAQRRAEAQGNIRSLRGGEDNYEGDYGEVNRAVMLVHAEVEVARAAEPDRPLHVVKVDLRDYYAQIPHDVLLEVLRRLGVPEDHLGVFRRFLSPPLQTGGGQPVRLRRGVPMGHGLSGMLGELLMRLLEQHIQRRARVRIVRVVDDLCILTPDADAAVAAWEGVATFCEAVGLRVNAEKSGAVSVGGPTPEGLPTGRPRWGMLELDEHGRWSVHAATFEAHLEQTRARMEAAPSVLGRVQLSNANLAYLLNAIVLGARLGDAHRESAGRAVLRYHRGLFGRGRGIVDELRAVIGDRFRSDLEDDAAIPEAWIYWPITAGGLALKNPLVVAGQYEAALRDLDPEPVPESRPADWDLRNNDWGAFYGQFLEPIRPIEPEESKAMKSLVDDFVARGADVSAGRQRDLSPYWRWILCTYGPQILKRFGTFRFLITELVPLQLISRQLVQGSSLDEAGPGADEDD